MKNNKVTQMPISVNAYRAFCMHIAIRIVHSHTVAFKVVVRRCANMKKDNSNLFCCHTHKHSMGDCHKNCIHIGWSSFVTASTRHESMYIRTVCTFLQRHVEC